MEKFPAKIKQGPEDFIVEEIEDNWHCKISEDFTQPEIKVEESEKTFLWCELEKRNIDHFSSIKETAKQLQISNFQIGYAGTKDKLAHTCQRISLENPNIELLKKFSHEKIILKKFRWNKRKIKMGYLTANHFKIILRDLDKKDAIKATNLCKKTKFFPNYFGPQRFGINGQNVEIGKLLLKKKFEEATKILFQEKIQNPLPAIKSIPRKNLLMYIHSVQSQIFNDIVSTALKENLNLEEKGQQSGILAGFKTRFSTGKLGEIEQEILKKHNLELEDFNLQEIPFLRIKGSFRKAITPIENLKLEIEDDEKFEGSKKISLEFTLPSGTYATTFLENFFTFQ